MPNPNGTLTRDEIRRSITTKTALYMADGINPDNAMDLAVADHKREAEARWAAKEAEVLNWLGVRSN